MNEQLLDYDSVKRQVDSLLIGLEEAKDLECDLENAREVVVRLTREIELYQEEVRHLKTELTKTEGTAAQLSYAENELTCLKDELHRITGEHYEFGMVRSNLTAVKQKGHEEEVRVLRCALESNKQELLQLRSELKACKERLQNEDKSSMGASSKELYTSTITVLKGEISRLQGELYKAKMLNTNSIFGSPDSGASGGSKDLQIGNSPTSVTLGSSNSDNSPVTDNASVAVDLHSTSNETPLTSSGRGRTSTATAGLSESLHGSSTSNHGVRTLRKPRDLII